MTITSDNSTLKVLGLPAEQGRWLLIPLGMTILLCLGTVYSWSIFRNPLETQLGLTATESLLPYTVALFCYALLMPIAGFYIPRVGTRVMTAIGGVVVGLGYILSNFAGNIMTMTLSYGMIAGIGVGITYGVPMVVVARWFPDKKGLTVGLTLVGFGLSPLITAPLAKSLIDAYGVQSSLFILGIAFILIILAIATTMKLPPKEWQPSQKRTTTTAIPATTTYPTNLLKSPSFYGLWICYTIGTFVGLSAIGISSPVGQEIIEIDPGVAARSVALFALFNGGSRPLFGWLADRFKPRYVVIGAYTLILIACILMVNAGEGQVATYLIAFGLFWFCLGGWLAIAPTLTLQLFNPEDYAQNYGIVFTAYGVGALLGTLVAGQMRDWFGSYTYAFYPMAGLAIIGIVVASLMLKRDRAA
ncbi:OFA family MFS transporter [Spirulina sp. CS-785/01]|uniref:L-lactate MFS transporter n=1 Tax=Spirulina sp. CS-785/01 TaxID=3021716 RepID=UPI00233061C7|nr:OFA family MFS transporter [Spirulina sp. CS-785/01]MDB9312911.1 OFA family MFS transporter [Spirulina sp. CS-785/01]